MLNLTYLTMKFYNCHHNSKNTVNPYKGLTLRPTKTPDSTTKNKTAEDTSDQAAK